MVWSSDKVCGLVMLECKALQHNAFLKPDLAHNNILYYIIFLDINFVVYDRQRQRARRGGGVYDRQQQRARRWGGDLEDNKPI